MRGGTNGGTARVVAGVCLGGGLAPRGACPVVAPGGACPGVAPGGACPAGGRPGGCCPRGTCGGGRLGCVALGGTCGPFSGPKNLL